MTKQHRRAFLATVGLGSAALAGCTGSLDFGSDDNDDDGNTTDPDENGDEAPENVTPPAITGGDLIDGFEEIEWQPMFEHTSVGAGDPLVGEGSLLVESDAEQAGAYRSFPDGLDIEGKQLSLAVRVDSPLPADVTVEVRAPGGSDRLTSTRRIPSEYGGWLRMEVGWTGRRGEPNLANVSDIRVYAGPDGDAEGPIRFTLDDLRATESADGGYVVITFDDAVQNQYTTALPMLEERGWPGVAAVIPGSLNNPDRLTLGQCREMRDAGWDISAHGGTALPELDDDERVETLEETQSYIANRIGEEGARHYFAPYNRMDAASMADVREVYDSSFIFGGHPNVAPPTDGHMLSRVNGHALDAIPELLDLAADYNQVLVTAVHGVGVTDSDLNDITEAEFETLLDEIESRDLKVITASELFDI